MHHMNNLRSVDLNLLVVLDALLAERHLSRAAQRLNMSQPAVSHALARLRNLLEDPLFVREHGRMTPTLRALELAPPLSEAITQIRSVLSPSGFDAESRHVFHLCLSDYGTDLLLPPLMRRLRQTAPRIELIVTQKSRQGMIGGVVEGETDLGFGVFPELPAQVERHALFEDEYACLLDPACQPQPFSALTAEGYWAAPHVLVAVHGQSATELDLYLRRYRRSRRIALILPHWSVAPKVVAGTDLILTVARRCLPDMPSLAIVPPPVELPSIPFSAIYHRRRRADPALRWLMTEIEACQGETACRDGLIQPRLW